MTFKVDERVVCPAFGVGRIVGLVSKKMLAAADTQLYYEVMGERSTMWVQVDESAARGLRRLTRKDELGRYRALLRRAPAPLSPDKQQRQQELRSRLKRGTLRDLCETVRDLTGQGWQRPLNEADASALRKGREALCQEWAAADGVTLAEATAEINELLLQARQAAQA
ncbi:MAG: hypothetical protein IT318_19840 [Anaerolineales bacterium]|nr:hypothetical protein [Anaerolineales bacterium]